MFNLSKGFDPTEIKISDFLIGSLAKDTEYEEETDLSQDFSDDESDSADQEQSEFRVIDFSNLESYTSEAVINPIIKEEIYLDTQINEPEEQEEGLIRALDIDKLTRFDQILIEDDTYTEDFSEEELSEVERGKQIAEDMFAEKLKEAEEIIRKSQEEADMIRQAAVFAAEKIKKDAETEGMAKGYNEGYNDGMIRAHEEIKKAVITEVDAVKEAVGEILDLVSVEKQNIFEKYEQSLTNIALSTAEKIVKVSLQSSGDVIKGMIRDATKDLKKTEWIKIYISKYDFEMIREADYDLVDSLSGLSDDIKVIIMEQEEIGTAIIETDKEVIDLSAATQLNNIKEMVESTI